jgi:hypothetical protein
MVALKFGTVADLLGASASMIQRSLAQTFAEYSGFGGSNRKLAHPYLYCKFRTLRMLIEDKADFGASRSLTVTLLSNRKATQLTSWLTGNAIVDEKERRHSTILESRAAIQSAGLLPPLLSYGITPIFNKHNQRSGQSLGLIIPRPLFTLTNIK